MILYFVPVMTFIMKCLIKLAYIKSNLTVIQYSFYMIINIIVQFLGFLCSYRVCVITVLFHPYLLGRIHRWACLALKFSPGNVLNFQFLYIKELFKLFFLLMTMKLYIQTFLNMAFTLFYHCIFLGFPFSSRYSNIFP